MKINASITDFPLYTSLETFFQEFKRCGVDSVELVIGFKARNLEKAQRLATKYNLPIVSLHQSIHSGIGLGFDERYLVTARQMGIRHVVFHPLALTVFDTHRLHNYFQKLHNIQKKYDIVVCLENMNGERIYRQLFTPPYETMEKQLHKMYKIAEEYGIFLTYDTSHAALDQPQKNNAFRAMFPKIKNIHLSSFTTQQEHLPLDKGNFDTEGFLQYLQKEKYRGLLTFEINYSLFKRMVYKYDFSEIERSVKIIRKNLS